MIRSAGPETTDLPGGSRAHLRDKLQRWLAAWFAALLAIASIASPSLPIGLTAPAALAKGHAEGEKPPTGVLAFQPDTAGILSRLPLLETALASPALKAPLPGQAADQPLWAPVVAMVPDGEPTGLFQRSAVGTARTPTGPPA